MLSLIVHFKPGYLSLVWSYGHTSSDRINIACAVALTLNKEEIFKKSAQSKKFRYVGKRKNEPRCPMLSFFKSRYILNSMATVTIQDAMEIQEVWTLTSLVAWCNSNLWVSLPMYFFQTVHSVGSERPCFRIKANFIFSAPAYVSWVNYAKRERSNA